jgi:hypothetical protein
LPTTIGIEAVREFEKQMFGHRTDAQRCNQVEVLPSALIAAILLLGEGG